MIGPVFGLVGAALGLIGHMVYVGYSEKVDRRKFLKEVSGAAEARIHAAMVLDACNVRGQECREEMSAYMVTVGRWSESIPFVITRIEKELGEDEKRLFKERVWQPLINWHDDLRSRTPIKKMKIKQRRAENALLGWVERNY